MAKKKTLYDVLGVPETASQADIQARYRALRREYNVDRVPQDLVDVRRQVTLMLQRCGEAYETLKDPAKRKHYDAELAKMRAASQGSGPSAQTQQQRRSARTGAPRGAASSQSHARYRPPPTPASAQAWAAFARARSTIARVATFAILPLGVGLGSLIAFDEMGYYDSGAPAAIGVLLFFWGVKTVPPFMRRLFATSPRNWLGATWRFLRAPIAALYYVPGALIFGALLLEAFDPYDLYGDFPSELWVTWIAGSMFIALGLGLALAWVVTVRGLPMIPGVLSAAYLSTKRVLTRSKRSLSRSSRSFSRRLTTMTKTLRRRALPLATTFGLGLVAVLGVREWQDGRLNVPAPVATVLAAVPNTARADSILELGNAYTDVLNGELLYLDERRSLSAVHDSLEAIRQDLLEQAERERLAAQLVALDQRRADSVAAIARARADSVRLVQSFFPDSLGGRALRWCQDSLFMVPIRSNAELEVCRGRGHYGRLDRSSGPGATYPPGLLTWCIQSGAHWASRLPPDDAAAREECWNARGEVVMANHEERFGVGFLREPRQAIGRRVRGSWCIGSNVGFPITSDRQWNACARGFGSIVGASDAGADPWCLPRPAAPSHEQVLIRLHGPSDGETQILRGTDDCTNAGGQVRYLAVDADGGQYTAPVAPEIEPIAPRLDRGATQIDSVLHLVRGMNAGSGGNPIILRLLSLAGRLSMAQLNADPNPAAQAKLDELNALVRASVNARPNGS